MPALNICARRLVNQHLITQKLVTGSDVVRPLGAVQAQDYLGAKWALSRRTRGATEAQIEREISDGLFLRTHVLRPTWHFVAPEDIRWMLRLTAPRIKNFSKNLHRNLDITAAVLKRSTALIEKALKGGHHLTRQELSALLQKARI